MCKYNLHSCYETSRQNSSNINEVIKAVVSSFFIFLRIKSTKSTKSTKRHKYTRAKAQKRK